MPSESFVINEITGSQRTVELRNRALPYQAVQWGGSQHYVQTWYPGNPQATIQVLGPREEDVSINGMWKSRYIGDHVSVTGFDDIIQSSESMTAEKLVQIFHILRRSGNLLEVRWGPEIRRGILKEFTPDYDRVEDIRWTCVFAWTQVGDRPAPRASETSQPESELESSMDELDEVASEVPETLLPSSYGPLLTDIAAIRAGVVGLSAVLATIFGKIRIEVATRKAVEAFVKQILIDSNSVIDQSTNGTYLPFVPIDTLDRVFDAENWRRSIGSATRGVQIAAIRARENVRQRGLPNIRRVVKVRQNQTLRTIALAEYGSSDDWQIIGNANNIYTPIVAPGTTIVIPNPPQTSSGVRLIP